MDRSRPCDMVLSWESRYTKPKFNRRFKGYCNLNKHMERELNGKVTILRTLILSQVQFLFSMIAIPDIETVGQNPFWLSLAYRLQKVKTLYYFYKLYVQYYYSNFLSYNSLHQNGKHLVIHMTLFKLINLQCFYL